MVSPTPYSPSLGAVDGPILCEVPHCFFSGREGEENMLFILSLPGFASCFVQFYPLSHTHTPLSTGGGETPVKKENMEQLYNVSYSVALGVIHLEAPNMFVLKFLQRFTSQ